MYARFGMALGDMILGAYPSSDFPSPRKAWIAVTTDASFVCSARRYARVELDFIGTHRRLPLAAIDELFERAVRDFPEWRGNIADMFSHARVLLENANGFARLMLDVARRAEPEWFLSTEELAEQARLNASTGFYTSDRERTAC